MLMQQVRVMARDMGIKPGKLTKAALIQTIQSTEGNYACFGTANDGQCDQMACLWREDCLGKKARA